MVLMQADRLPAETLAYQPEPHRDFVLVFEEGIGLTHPAVIAGIILVIGIGLWLWHRRRKSVL
jgi:LPXTG-motif cell wall-anchored protein